MLEWKDLTRLTGSQDFHIERVRLADSGVAIEGAFEPPQIAKLPADDLAFVAAFIHCHGSIKKMEKWFGVSYPTIKSRLNQIAGKLDFVETDRAIAPGAKTDVLDRLERGEISVDEAVSEIES